MLLHKCSELQLLLLGALDSRHLELVLVDINPHVFADIHALGLRLELVRAEEDINQPSTFQCSPAEH